MADSTEVLTWQYLTALINEILPPASFLVQTLYGRTETLHTESFELSFLTGGRQTAPFVKVDGEAILVKGRDKQFVTVTGPNIRLKMPFTPSALLFDRQPGTIIFPGQAEALAAIEQHIARDVQVMADMIGNVEEWMAAMALQGSISYSVDDGAAWQITYPKPTANTFTPSTEWGAAGATPASDFLLAKRKMNTAVRLAPSLCIMGEEASVGFMNDAQVQALLDTNNYQAGNVTIEEQYNEQGVIRLGRFSGINCVEYSTTVEVDGVETDLIRPKYAEFVNTTPAAQNVLYYFAIPDIQAFRGRLYVGKRFSKSWEIPDPSAIIYLTHTRPLPVPRRPGSIVSCKAQA
jgi:hypothetical protein